MPEEGSGAQVRCSTARRRRRSDPSRASSLRSDEADGFDVVSSNLLSCKQHLQQKARLLGRTRNEALGLVIARAAGALSWRGEAMGIRSQPLKTNRDGHLTQGDMLLLSDRVYFFWRSREHVGFDYFFEIEPSKESRPAFR